ncbi:aspartic peptidase domain-containing protein [Cristinia sonorae]|uniref:Aspartic peptidase domain-containing protein n=1 Tax=Cristinia sonorae TaxID=1940300 RepID=A0A8K0UEV7_9AGAR|nr:aspartic peptidase domain-containing protein [Cristinia sonorae]
MWRICARHVLTLVTVFLAVPIVSCARLPHLQRDAIKPPTQLRYTNPTNASDPYSFGVANFQGDSTTFYFITISVDGHNLTVALDTGSSDLWINTAGIDFSNKVVNTNQNVSLLYADQSGVDGPILVGEVKIGDFVVDKQAFIAAAPNNATVGGYQGLLGLGPSANSRINELLANTTFNGAPLLQNVFSTYPNVSTFMTLQMNRSTYGISNGGAFTIGKVDPTYSEISNATRLPVLTGSAQWITVMDSVIINGKNMSGNGMLDNASVIASVPAKYQHKLVTLLDSGAALATGPPSYVDAIYGNLTGASLMEDTGGVYKLPCDTKINVSMVFAGVEYPVNPLDLITVDTDLDNVTVGCFSTIGYSPPETQTDWILGDAFLRNVYALFDYGSDEAEPFIQLHSTVDMNEAWSNFDFAATVRTTAFKSYVLGDNTTVPSPSIVSPSSVPTSANTNSDKDAIGALSESDGSDAARHDYNILMTNAWVIIGLLAFVIILLLVLIAMVILRGRQERRYTPLRNSGGAMEVAGYGSGKGSVYETPYDS